MDFRLNLGAASAISSAKYLWLNADAPSTNLASPSSLQLPFYRPNVAVVTNASGVIEQVNAPEGLVNISVANNYEYSLQCFYATNVTGMTSGLYGTNAPAFVTWTVQNPDGASASNRLWITEQRGGNSWQSQYSFGSGSNELSVLESDGKTTISTWQIANPTNANVTNFFTQVSENGSILSENVKTYQSIPANNNMLLLQEIDGYGSNSQTTTYTYYTNGPASNLLQSVSYPEGKWTYFLYDEYGRVTNQYDAYGNDSLPSDGSAPNPATCKLTQYAYSLTNTVDGVDYPGNTNNMFMPAKTSVDIYSQEVSRTYHIAYAGYDEVHRCVTPGSLWTNPNCLTNITYTYFGGGYTAGKPYEVVDETGAQTTYAYPNTNTVIEYDPDATETTNVLDDWGNPLSSTRVDSATGVVLGQTLYTYTNSSGEFFDPLRRSYTVADLAGRITEYNYGCCGLESMTDPDGVITLYNYDMLKNQTAQAISHDGGSSYVTTTNTLDGLGRVLATQRIGTNGDVITDSACQYDVLGRVIAMTNALNGVTATSYFIFTNGGGDVQSSTCYTYPNGGTRNVTNCSDGRVESITGTAAHGMEYGYGVEEDPEYGCWVQYTAQTNLTAIGGTTTEWIKTYTDAIGRTYKTIYPNNATNESYYNEYGQLWKQTDPDGVATMTVFDNSTNNLDHAMGEYTIGALTSAALEIGSYDTPPNDLLDALPTLEQDGIDRITCVTQMVAVASGSLPNAVQRDTYKWTNGETDGSGTLVSRMLTSADGLQQWDVTYSSADVAATNYSSTSPGVSRSAVSVMPNRCSTVDSYSYGRLASSIDYDSTGAEIGGSTYGYDAYGRTCAIIDARNGATTYAFNNADLVAAVTTPLSETTTNEYDDMLEVTNVVEPDGKSISSTYLLTGELGLQYGSRIYPVGYSYDYAGRMATMTNWSNFSGNSGARVTRWNYDPYRGFLSSKTYDGGAPGPSYTYTPAGRPASRTWARGVTTTYNYDTVGALTNIVYSDSTPSVTNTYDRLGRLGAVIQNDMTDVLAYNLDNQLISESFSGGVLNGLSMTNNYDADLRRTSLTALSSGSPLFSTAYSYDNASRLSAVSDGNGNSATYSYIANSPLVGQIMFAQSSVTRMTTTKQYDYLNRLTQISSVPSAAYTEPATFNYSYNSANQRIKDALADGSYWVYGYDSLGQVTNGVKYFPDGTPVAGQQFGYTFDTIGNRAQTMSGGDQNGQNLRVANYSANNLNQITNRDIPGDVDVMGASILPLTNVVTVNGQVAYRNQEYFRQQVAVNNGSSALWTNMTVVGGQTVSGNEYVPKEPEHLSYDADGNLTNDGRWSYVWDGENRLIRMTVNTSVGPQYQLDFVYDYQGRRIQKSVATNGVGIYTNIFLYSGRNLIATLNPQSSVLASYVWGLDLSGSQQSAGGVGGLLEMTSFGSSTTNCFVAYDGNGNVMALVNAAGGTLAANYDYGPFGEPLRVTGPMGPKNPLRFSTKYDDDESDLLYYGYRYYRPSAGIWLNRDPAEERSGSVNLYAFAANFPTTAVDGDGRRISWTFGGGGGTGCGGWSNLWDLKFTPDQTVASPQWWVSKITETLTVYNCQLGVTENIAKAWWEATQVQVPFQEIYYDKDIEGGYPLYYGTHTIEAETRFYSDIDVGSTIVEWGYQNPTSNPMYSTWDPPWFWDGFWPLYDGPATRESGSTWNCCCGGPPYFSPWHIP